MTRTSFIFPLFCSITLFGCDRALDNRYEGLVVVPIQEVPVAESNAPEDLLNIVVNLSDTEIPLPRPNAIPLRELTPAEAILAADETALAASVASDNLLAAQNAEAQALERLAELQANLDAPQVEQLPSDLEIAPIIGEDVVLTDLDALDLEDQTSLDARFSDDPTISGLPKERPESFPQSSDQLDAFLAAEAARKEEAERQAQAEQLAAATARQAEAEKLAAERVEAERLAAVAMEEARLAQASAAAELARQAAAEEAAAAAAAEAERLANLSNFGNDLDELESVVHTGVLALPLSYRDTAPIETLQNLQEVYDEADYSLAQVIAGQPVPALILQRIPRSLGALGNTNPPLQKELFIKAALPLCLVTNARIQQEYNYVVASGDEAQILSEAIDPVMRGLGAKYQAATAQDLMKKAQGIPVSLCLAQAVLSTDWGSNLSALDQNALFGPWVRNPTNSKRILPKSTLSNTDSRSVLFRSLQAATDAFALYLNRDEALNEFREERFRSTLQDRLIPGLVAAEYMSGLAPQDSTLTVRLIQTIRDNRLSQYNLTRLQDGPRRAVPVL